MIEGEDKRARGVLPYEFTSPRACSLDVVAFDPPVLTEHLVRIQDLSVVGLGITSLEPINPGLVCFREPVAGQKYGVIIWCKLCIDKYRTGIRFVILPSEEEAFLKEQVKQSQPFNVLQDPDKIIANLLESIKNETRE